MTEGAQRAELLEKREKLLAQRERILAYLPVLEARCAELEDELTVTHEHLLDEEAAARELLEEAAEIYMSVNGGGPQA
jgi:hypothetical protein